MRRSRVPDTILDDLGRIPALSGCPRDELVAIDRCTTPASFAAGATLCREGHPGREAFVIVDGEVDVTVAGRHVARLGAGTFCGEMALVERGVRSATVTAVTPVRVLAMSVAEFEQLLERAPCMTRRMLATLSTRLRDVDRAVVDR